jgi:hypothetical protein
MKSQATVIHGDGWSRGLCLAPRAANVKQGLHRLPRRLHLKFLYALLVSVADVCGGIHAQKRLSERKVGEDPASIGSQPTGGRQAHVTAGHRWGGCASKVDRKGPEFLGV